VWSGYAVRPGCSMDARSSMRSLDSLSYGCPVRSRSSRRCPEKPCRPGGAPVSLRTTRSTAWRRATWDRWARSRHAGTRGHPSPVAIERVLGGRCRTRAMVPAPSLARRVRRLRVEAVRAARYPAPVRQSVLASRRVIAVRRVAVRPAVRRPTLGQAAVRPAAVPCTAVGRGAIGRACAKEAAVSRPAVGGTQGRAEVRGELAWRAYGRVGLLAESRLTRWYLAGTPQQLAVVIVGLDRSARSCPFGLLVVGEGRVYAIR
jgi:hypothetical protein